MSDGLDFDLLSTPEVRDLAYALGAPGLLEKVPRTSSRQDGREARLADWEVDCRRQSKGVESVVLGDNECAKVLREAWSRLLELDRDPRHLLAWLEARPARQLGRYFEALVQYWLVELLRARRLTHSIVMKQGRQTTGELDFVFEDVDGKLCHWEASVKFYLCMTPYSNEARDAGIFWGTLHRDRLDRKLRVLERQIAAPQTPEGREAILGAGYGANDNLHLDTRLLMKGALFYPLTSSTPWREFEHPPEVSPSHLRGWWASELPKGDAWVELEKRRWLSPYRGAQDFVPWTRAQAQSALQVEKGAQMMARLQQGADGLWRELDRGIVQSIAVES